MPRPMDIKLRNKVLEYLKLEYLKTGEGVSIPLSQIAREVGENPKNASKILNTVNKLERRGNIRIIRGEGKIPNKYEYISNYPKKWALEETKRETENNLNELTQKLNDSLSDIVSYCSSVSKEHINKEGYIAYLEEAVSRLKFFGKTVEGHDVFVAEDTTPSFTEAIEKIKEKNKEKKRETENEKEDVEEEIDDNTLLAIV